jgi:hypothetical protein
MYFMRRSIYLLAVGLTVTACGSNSSPTGPSNSTTTAPAGLGSTFAFTRSPVDPAVIEFITPLGNLNPPGHTIPTDHIYFYHHLNHRSAPQYEVFAPADGIIGPILRGNDDAIYVWTSKTHMYYLGHVILDAGFAQNQKVTAGQRLGVTSTLSFGLDLGLLNYDITLPFVMPARYSDNSLHADAPLKFFSDPLKSQLYALVEGTGANRDGQINFDQAGRLAGNWFHESLPVSESAGPSGWTRHLAFVRDNRDPSQIRISIGGMITTAGVYSIAAADPDPASVTTGSGSVTFNVVSGAFGGPSGPMVVTMMTDARIRIQFAGNEQFYVR